MYYQVLSFMIPSIGVALGLGFAIVPLTLKFLRKSGASSCQAKPFAPIRHRNSTFLSFKPAQLVLLGISATLLSVAGHAAGDNRFVLAAYSNAPGGQKILSGDYQAALAVLNTKSGTGGVEPAYISLNRCVALTMAKNWPAAQTACDSAVRNARLARLLHSEEGVEALHVWDETIAIAYSDRAVLKWLTDDARTATQDLEHAKSVLPNSSLVAQNVMALDQRSTLATVRSAEQR